MSLKLHSFLTPRVHAVPCKSLFSVTSLKHTDCVAQGFEVLDSQDQTDVVWAGDMNWNADDGEPPLPAGWYEPFTLSLIPAPRCLALAHEYHYQDKISTCNMPERRHTMLLHLLLAPALL